MNIETNIEKLKNSILLAEKITGKNLTLPVLSSILFIASGKTLKLRATNLSIGIEVEIPVKVEKEGVIALPGNVLSNIFSNFSQNETVSLIEENGNILIKTKKNKIKLKAIPYEDFPTIPVVSGEEIQIESKKLIDGIKSVYYSASTSDIKPEISSVYLYSNNDELIFVATDSFRLAEKKVKIKNIPEINGILIPFKNIPEILRVFGEADDDIKICFNKNQISFSTNGMYFTSRIIDGNFPDYKQIIPKEKNTEVIILKQDILNALKISNIFSDKFNQLFLSVKPKEKIFEIYSENGAIGENKTVLEGSISGEEVLLSFNYKYFLDCLTSISADSVLIKLNGPQKPMVISGVSDQSFTYLIMPMNR